MIADVEARKGNLPKVLRDLKSISAKQLLRAISEHPDETRKEWLMRLFQFFANRYQHDSEHHFWQFGNQPVDIEKIVKKDKPIPSPIDKLLRPNSSTIPPLCLLQRLSPPTGKIAAKEGVHDFTKK